MKASRTTIAGAAAGTCFAAAQLPGINPTTELALKLGAAVAIAALGNHASDCPANCAGTDENRRPRPSQRMLFGPLVAVILAVIVLTYTTGCVTKNPQAGQGTPPAPAYIVSPQLSAISNAVTPLATTAGEVTGTGPLLPTATNAAFLLVASLSALWARHKSATADALAQGIAKAGPTAVSTVLRSASDGPKYAAVATALNQQLSAGQAPGQDPAQKN